MNNCLVTKLKATVNNPDLPVLETMQQFTLDAIAKGGNTVLTDDQKWALNHFFYEIGAIGETGIWNKIRTLFIPLIGTDRAHCVLDYREDGITFTNQAIIKDQPGCIEYNNATYNTSAVIINGKDLTNAVNLFNSSILMCTAPGSYISIGTDSQIGFSFGDSISKTYYRYYSSNNNYITAEVRESANIFNSRLEADLQTKTTVAVCNFNNSHNGIYAVDEDGIIRDTSQSHGSATNLPSTVSASSYKLAIGSGTKYGVIIDFSSELTEGESLKVLNATNALRNMFL